MSLSAPDDDPPIFFYTTRTFDFGQQIRITQSADGFLGSGIGGSERVEDPFWSGTGRVGEGVREVPGVDSAGTGSLKRPVPDEDNFVCTRLVLSSQLSIASHGLQLTNGTNGDANGTLPDAPMEGQTFLAWDSGQSNLISATTALIQGIDQPNVKYIVFHEGTYGLISYHQGSGRAGRTGSPASVFVVFNGAVQYVRPGRPGQAADYQVRLLLKLKHFYFIY